MKLKIILPAMTTLMAHLSYGQITDPAPYCAAQYDDEILHQPHYISEVSLGSLDNASGNTQYAAPHYVYYNNITAPALATGATYNLSVTHDPPPASIHFVAVYIDYNHNASFDDPGEKVLQQAIMTGITNPSTASITIPATATPGITRMRVMVFEDDSYMSYNATPCTADATGYMNWGETEDYNVNITAATGIDDIGKSNTRLAFPNPANNTLYLDERLTGKEMILYGIDGKLMQPWFISNKKIDISTLPPGLYILKAIDGNNVYTQRFTIARP